MEHTIAQGLSGKLNLQSTEIRIDSPVTILSSEPSVRFPDFPDSFLSILYVFNIFLKIRFSSYREYDVTWSWEGHSKPECTKKADKKRYHLTRKIHYVPIVIHVEWRSSYTNTFKNIHSQVIEETKCDHLVFVPSKSVDVHIRYIAYL